MMHRPIRPAGRVCNLLALAALLAAGTMLPAHGQDVPLQDVTAPSSHQHNPDRGSAAAVHAGHRLYAKHCASCHGARAEGSGNIPALARGATQQATPGALFHFITRGYANAGMPAWDNLPEAQRWHLVTFLKSLHGRLATPLANPRSDAGSAITAPPPTPPFTDFRQASPGTSHTIGVADLPAPYATRSASNGAHLVPRPKTAWPKAPPGFRVQLFAHDGLDNPRMIRIAPNGDIFVAETAPGRILVFRGIGGDGRPERRSVFATGLNQPFGIAFYPSGTNPKWIYIGDNDAVLRLPYRNGDLKSRGRPQHIADLPHGGGHSTRNLVFSRDGRTLFVAVGSASNVDDPDTHPEEYHRANILAMDPDGSHLRVYASGIRNPVGLAIDPRTGELWTSVNERDGLGNDLVPDYITHVRRGGFYGWPWWYMGGHQDPRLRGTHPELKDKVITPDVLLQPHNASLNLTFYEGRQFPATYRGDIFAAEHGSWNRSPRVGYEVIRVPVDAHGRATGSYEDFLTGFVLPDGSVWGRPVGVAVASDGSLLVSDDGSDSIWRVSHIGR